MSAPTAEELLDVYEELNYPSATKFRAALLKQGYRVRLADVEKFVQSQTPTQLFKTSSPVSGENSGLARWGTHLRRSH